ncbi:ras-related protein Rab-13-like [Corticium candelabrum]|uniref:ras-related protein Rab-13-like n=1 Tax=Corticium candelabrum TaxID=121492 RepID=UPI002E25471F|nr:ras-related protein Rab-13-like [Corticium candelabrum]
MSDNDVVARTYKIVVIGEQNAGKTSIIRRFTENEFIPSHSNVATVGVDFKRKIVEIDGLRIMLHLWDTAGQERFHTITRLHFRGALGIIMVFDITNMESFHQLEYWVQRIRDEPMNKETLVVLGNKCDLSASRKVSASKAQAFVKNMGIRYYETSALTDVNITEAIVQLAKDIKDVHGPHVYLPSWKKSELWSDEDTQTNGTDHIDLSAPPPDKPNKSCGCSGAIPTRRWSTMS